MICTAPSQRGRGIKIAIDAVVFEEYHTPKITVVEESLLFVITAAPFLFFVLLLSCCEIQLIDGAPANT